jgi:hypothetical protein
MKKTVRVPVAADGVPIAVPTNDLEKTRELPACPAPRSSAATEADDLATPCGFLAGDGIPAQAAPREILDDDVTVPVQSSLESTLTFELLRRQSIPVDDEDDDGNKR